jgi:hypothetical protein
MRTLFAALFISTLAVSPTQAATALVATKITAANAAQHVKGGLDATGGIGDWALSNGTLCVIIAGLENEGDFSSRGGTLRDIGFCGRDDDQFVSQQDLLDGSLAKPVGIIDVRAETGKNAASITSLGSYRGLMVETRYTLDAKNKARLGVTKRIWRADEDAANTGILASATLNYHSMKTFLLNSHARQRSNGFAQEQFVGRGILSYTDAARPVDTVMMMSPHDLPNPVSYAMRQLSAQRITGDGELVALPAFALSDSSALAFLTLTDAFTFGDGSKLGLTQLLQVPFMGLDVGDEIRLEEEILIAPSADVGGLTDMIFADAPVLSGAIANPDRPVRVHIDLADGTPFTQTTPDSQGRFAAHVPAGDYRLRVLSQAADPVVQPVSVTRTGAQLAPIAVPQVAKISLPQGHAMRLAFRGLDTTPDPHFEDDLTGYSVSGEDGPMNERIVSDIHLTGSAGDARHVHLPDGTYQVYGVRGPEYDITTAILRVSGGKDQNLVIAAPQRAVTTQGHLAADMHVHSAPSLDNAFAPMKRVRTFVAEHGEIMVAAEHDTIFDFNPLIRQMGVSDKMIAITGTEVTSTQQTERAPYSIGHMNFFPLTPKPHAHKNGLPNHENRRTRDVLHDMHVHFDDPVAQLNHPRDSFKLSGKTLPDDHRELINDEQFFDHMGVAAHPYNPHKPLTEAPNNSLIEAHPVTRARDIDFDVMEIMNGTQSYRPERVDAARQDWLSLVAQGEKLAATANSDSHNKWQIVAMPRNMVRLGADRLADFSLRRFTDAVKRGAFYGTTGPFIDLRLGAAQIGETHKGNSATLSGRIYSAAWARAERLRVQLNGVTTQEITLPKDGRFALPLEFAADGFVTIEAIGTPGETYQAVYPGFFPYAYSNPIYVDADGDGEWTPPGLPALHADLPLNK